MKVYAVKHEYDNGLSYEDYREYESVSLFSSYKQASEIFWDNATSDYQGKYTLLEWELDSQNKTVLEETPYIACMPEYYNEEEYADDYIDYDSDEGYYYNSESWELIYDYCKAIAQDDSQKDIDDWLTHKGENYEIFHQIEQDRIDKLLQTLNELLG